MVRREVHYCAYGHFYMKPTHIWTDMMGWAPHGDTETEKCEGRCKEGMYVAGRYHHKYRISQESSRAHGGPGRKAKRNMMPAFLHAELMGATVMARRTPPAQAAGVAEAPPEDWEI